MTLTQEEMRRYSRQLAMPEVSVEGQSRLKGSRVLLVGTGGLGSPAGLYLAAAGVGRLGLIDFDAVSVSNLHRQILYSTNDVGRPKLEAARDRLASLNPGITIATHDTRLSSKNALDLFENYDIIVDGSDNFATRYLVNDACVLAGKPNVYGSVLRFSGQASVFGLDGGPCYRCLYPEPPPPGLVPDCDEAGVLGVLPGIIGSIQAAEAIKLIIGAGVSLSGRLLLLDALKMATREIEIPKDPECPVCGPNRTIDRLIDYDAFCGASDDKAHPSSTAIPEITPLELKARLDEHHDVFLLDVREPFEYQICNLGGHLIPLAEIAARMNELDRAKDTVVYCRSGVRSAMVVGILRRLGFERVWNLRGGILAWADDIDPSITKY
jgi:molybdopterin/thiamine biosynthesis adenylyltransferase/rhodanese-related sulfurtransferase